MATRFSRKEINRTQIVAIKNVTSWTLFNTGSSELKLTIDGAEMIVPGYDVALFYAPPQYSFDGDGYPTDLEMTVEVISKSGSAILDYRALPKEC